MFTRTLAVRRLVFGVFAAGCSVILLGQQKPAVPVTSVQVEFPVIMLQSVTAGKTPIGAKVQAKLMFATLAGGTVIPRNAVFSGEVIESVAKTETGPSCLAILMNSAQWKNGSAAVKVYLTAWYYPAKDAAGQDLQYGPTEPANKTWNGSGAYPDPNLKSYEPMPGGEQNKGTSVPDTPMSATSNHRAWMKDVESASDSEGRVAIASRHSNLKLDKLTTYVLATSELRPAK